MDRGWQHAAPSCPGPPGQNEVGGSQCEAEGAVSGLGDVGDGSWPDRPFIRMLSGGSKLNHPISTEPQRSFHASPYPSSLPASTLTSSCEWLDLCAAGIPPSPAPSPAPGPPWSQSRSSSLPLFSICSDSYPPSLLRPHSTPATAQWKPVFP